ncbi:MAG: glycine cleavage system aminomethyltransferase GcvT [Chloroflexi bacterium]|nr:glycine cleavage system aminomethyltransferase GcvT [Chloroflexota bacterium]
MAEGDYTDFFNLDISEADPATDLIIGFEEERQARQIILIPSESLCPLAVRQALGSVFNNVYAEGYPPLRMTRDDEDLLLDFGHQLAYYRRYADRRFYKGVNYVHFVETLAGRRAAEAFATRTVPADRIYANVQPLSGAAANLAVYNAFLQDGDTLMGMDLFQGGHLTHGSPFNLSGQRYRVVSYGVDRRIERLDYDAILDLAKAHRPKMIVAGYTSYPWAPDWAAFRQIADAVGALLMADIAHTAGMAIAGVYPNPIGYADIVTFTTHKTLMGPRGAIILTTDEEKAKRIDAAVFPGEQGGPHTNKFAAMCVMFAIARTEKFRRLQKRIVENAVALAEAFQKRGIRVPYGGTNTHLLLVDVSAVPSKTGFPLRGEIAARILELAGIIVNKNTIPGDELTALGSGIRMGTPWVSQRGMTPAHMDRLAGIITEVVTNIQPFSYRGLLGELPRGKIDLDLLEQAKRDVDALVAEVKAETQNRGTGYPHYTITSTDSERARLFFSGEGDEEQAIQATKMGAAIIDTSDAGVLLLSGWRAQPFVQQITTASVAVLEPGQALESFMLKGNGAVLDDITIIRLTRDERGRDRYLVVTNPENTTRVTAWLRGLADGYTLFDPDDLFRKVDGPVVVWDMGTSEVKDEARLVTLQLVGPKSAEVLHRLCPHCPAIGKGQVWHGELAETPVIIVGQSHGYLLLGHPDLLDQVWNAFIGAGAEPGGPITRKMLRTAAGLPIYTLRGEDNRPSGRDMHRNGFASRFSLTKPYFIGQSTLRELASPANKEVFVWNAPQDVPLKRTPLYEWHSAHTRKIIPFAGWEMPIWYSSLAEEHEAVRNAAGLFDVAHMGVLEVSGPHAASFLDTVFTNYVRWIEDGQSLYGYLMDPDGRCMDDVMIYRRASDRFLLVVNAVNAEKDLAWLQAVNSRHYLIDREYPAREVEAQVTIRDLKDPASNTARRIDIALQGPNSLAILQRLASNASARRDLATIARTEFVEMPLAGMDLIIARTGYTGEEIGYELFVHPDEALHLWELLLEKGASLGIRPCGLAARDSTRIEAGLPLYGHELAGDYGIVPAEAGFAPYVKFHKPFFIGRAHCIRQEMEKTMEVVRFRVSEAGVPAVRPGDPVVNKRGHYIGRVTSATLVRGYQIGMAYVEKRYNQAGTPLAIFPQSLSKGSGGKPVEALTVGDRVALPVEATVLERFPQPEEKLTWRLPGEE